MVLLKLMTIINKTTLFQERSSMRQRVKLLMAVLLAFSNAHCVSANSKQESGLNIVDTGTDKHRVSASWQKNFLTLMKNNKDVEEGWGIFHEGGLTGTGSAGQVFLIQDKTQTTLYFVERGRSGNDKPDMEKALPVQKLQGFVSAVTPLAEQLTDHWETGFDMFETEFVHVVRKDNDLNVKQRVKWRFGREKCVKHCDLAKLFQDLVNSQK